MTVEIRPYRWTERGESFSADFFPFVDGEPRHDITCSSCRFFRGYETPCVKAAEVGDGDSKCYPFCGPICGHLEMDDQGGAHGG